MDDPQPDACFPSPFFLLRVGGGVKAPEKKIIMAKDTIVNTSLENVCTHASRMNTHTHIQTHSLTHTHAHLPVKYTKNRICCTLAVHVHVHIHSSGAV